MRFDRRNREVSCGADADSPSLNGGVVSRGAADDSLLLSFGGSAPP